MNAHAQKTAEAPTSALAKADPASPVFAVTGRDSLVIKAGAIFGGHAFHADTDITPPAKGYIAGADYVVTLDHSILVAAQSLSQPDDNAIGGFHFAPGGNALLRTGGDDISAINPCSLWDRNFRPSCADPRGMAFIPRAGAPFWCDIYLTGADAHEDGTSRFGVTIADGDDRPRTPDGKRYKSFDYATACAVMAAHGKGLLGFEEFFAAAFGVTEKTSAGRDPKTTGLDAPRTSRFGLMQATGNLWIWGHDGDPDEPRASRLGGSWFDDENAGSRRAGLAVWTDGSDGLLGARGRSDHLQLV